MLGDRDVDDLVGVDERRVDRPLVEDVAVEAHRAEAVLGGEDDLGAERVRRAPDARALEAAVRIVARGVGDDDASWRPPRRRAARPSATTSGLVLAAWIGMRSQPMLGFTTTTSPARDEALHPAERVDRATGEGRGVGSVLGDHQLR